VRVTDFEVPKVGMNAECLRMPTVTPSSDRDAA
jgi:hypothetical protein